MMEDILQPTPDPSWVLAADGYDPLRESSVESRFAISNGFLGVRGSRATTRGERWVMPARTYVAGLFDTSGIGGGMPGRAPAADWLKVRVVLPSGPLLHHPGEASSHRTTLDVRRGVLLSEARHSKTEAVGMHLRTLRLVSLGERSVGLQLIEMEVGDCVADMKLEAVFEGVELGLVTERLGKGLGLWHTQQSGKGLAMATVASLQVDGRELPPASLGPLGSFWSWKSRPGQVVTFERFVAIVRSGAPGGNPGGEAREKLHTARQIGWRGVVAAHEAAWASRWRLSDVAVAGDAEAQRGLRFALYHL